MTRTFSAFPYPIPTHPDDPSKRGRWGTGRRWSTWRGQWRTVGRQAGKRRRQRLNATATNYERSLEAFVAENGREGV